MVELQSCLKDGGQPKAEPAAVSSGLESPKATDLRVLPKATGKTINSSSGSRVAKKRSVNFNLTIDFKRCDELLTNNNQCDRGSTTSSVSSSTAATKALSSDFSDVESLCVPTTPGGRHAQQVRSHSTVVVLQQLHEVESR